MAIPSPLLFLLPLKALIKNKFEKKTRKMSSGPGRAGDVGMMLGGSPIAEESRHEKTAGTGFGKHNGTVTTYLEMC